MAMKWATEFCPETQFIFKCDDDVFVNTPYISQFIQRVGHLDNFITCRVISDSKVFRDKNSKWYVTSEEYPNETYPAYCSGWGILLTTDVAQKLHKAAETTPFFWVDDVYVLEFPLNCSTISARRSIRRPEWQLSASVCVDTMGNALSGATEEWGAFVAPGTNWEGVQVAQSAAGAPRSSRIGAPPRQWRLECGP
ncbi:beta-1,3-galactosyltransferase 5-like [Phlebotomus argentipes]|uniref:beta-1,3-galactosyltransferase 5-like n=1 Tax=Phlebotomus argentipes TaxID=94469 RepID=UPI00289382C1|nr:beta-1,3-galactosyltransferase 5-like [Phlebotomus argentipes]